MNVLTPDDARRIADNIGELALRMEAHDKRLDSIASVRAAAQQPAPAPAPAPSRTLAERERELKAKKIL